MFESLLLERLAALDPARPVYVEGESKKIGQLQVPDALIGAMRASPCVKLEAGVETRVALLMEEYRHFLTDRAALEAQLDCLVALHGREKIAEWKALGARGEWKEFVSRLLLEHYDPAYRRSSHHNFARLADAPQVRIASPDKTAFEQAANALLNPEEVSA
jgi:tRNA 2-selenouridine synthase